MGELRGEGLYCQNEDEHAETQEAVDAQHLEGVLLESSSADEVPEQFEH